MECGCRKCCGISLLVLGAILLLNIYVLNWSWWYLGGILLIISGFLKLAGLECKHQTCMMVKASPMKSSRKRRR